MAAVSLSSDQSQELDALHKNFIKKARVTSCSVAAASFLLIGALIVITCSSLCFMLPGVNVIRDIVFPGILPGSCALLLSIPFVLGGVKYARIKNGVRLQIVDKIIGYLGTYNVATMQKTKKIDQRADFIFKNFLHEGWQKEYKSKLIGEVKEKLEKSYPKDKTARTKSQKDLLQALDDARAKIFEKKKNHSS